MAEIENVETKAFQECSQKPRFCPNAVRAYKAHSDERAESQLPYLMPSGENLLGKALSPSPSLV